MSQKILFNCGKCKLFFRFFFQSAFFKFHFNCSMCAVTIHALTVCYLLGVFVDQSHKIYFIMIFEEIYCIDDDYIFILCIYDRVHRIHTMF